MHHRQPRLLLSRERLRVERYRKAPMPFLSHSVSAGRISAFLDYGYIGRAMDDPSAIRRIASNPVGSKLLRQAFELPINSPKFNETMRALAVMANDEERDTPGPRAVGKP